MVFKVGDEVIVINTKVCMHNSLIGKIGIIKKIDSYMKDHSSCAIEFTDIIYMGHDCEGYCKDGYGYWISSKEINLLNHNGTIKNKNNEVDKMLESGVKVKHQDYSNEEFIIKEAHYNKSYDIYNIETGEVTKYVDAKYITLDNEDKVLKHEDKIDQLLHMSLVNYALDTGNKELFDNILK